MEVISEYLNILYENNDFIIKNSQDFAQFIREQPAVKKNEEYLSYDVVSYNVELLLTGVSIHDTIKYILKEICSHINYQQIYVSN